MLHGMNIGVPGVFDCQVKRTEKRQERKKRRRKKKRKKKKERKRKGGQEEETKVYHLLELSELESK